MQADVRQRLEAERAYLTEELVRLTTDEQTRAADEPGYGNHPADDATDTLEVETDVALERHLRGLLHEVEHALQRLEHGTYGRCASCGAAINPERLTALPYATLCLACSQAGRQAEG